MDRQQIIAALLPRLKATDSLYEFVKQAWRHSEGDVPFVDGWHIGAVCEHLEAVTRREIRNLLINLPIRCSKSSIVSVLWPAWVWTTMPQEQFFYASYAASLALRDAVKSRRLILTPWYQRNWGDVFQLLRDQKAKSRYDNSENGYRLTSSVGATITGEGGSMLVVDDPNNAKEGESETLRESAKQWWDFSFSNRLNDPKTSCRVVVQQRLHESDISGHIMARESGAASVWTKLILPMEFETSRRSKTIVLPSTKGKPWEDPREKEGDLLWPNRFGKKELDELKMFLGSEYAVSGQLQQRPSPEAGGIIKKAWFTWWKKPRLPKLEYILQSWDTALEVKDKNSFSACTTWGVFKDDQKISHMLLLSLWRGRVEYPELRKMAQRLYEDYRDIGEFNLQKEGSVYRPHMVLIEAKVSGISLIQDLSRAGIIAFRFNPNKYGDKMQRVRLITHLIEAGRVWVMAKPPDFKQLRHFADVMVENAAAFPNADSRDLVDTMTQALLRLTESGWISHPSDRSSDTSVRMDMKFY
jgi:predicted phage terminase large subunit-like protein